MDPRILRIGSDGPQSGRFTQGRSRDDDKHMLKEHSPWNIRWIESSPTEDSTPTNTRFVLPGKGDILHAVYLIMELDNNETYTPIGPNLIEEVSFRGEGDILDRFTGEYIAIAHDRDRKYNEYIARDRLEGNISGGLVSYTGDIIIDLPFWFRKNIHSGLPLMDLTEDRHSFHIKTYQNIKSFKMIFEISDLTQQDKLYLSHPGRWSLPIVTRNRFVIRTNQRENLTVRLPFTDELCGIMFAFRPITDELSGNYLKFNDRADSQRTGIDLDPTSLTPIYREREQVGEILERASIKIGNMVLEDRESMWWREGAWRESGRQPPDRLQYVYARFWDITEQYPSGGTHLEYVPSTDLVVKLKCDAPDCTMIIWGLTRNVAEIRKLERRLILRNPFNG